MRLAYEKLFDKTWLWVLVFFIFFEPDILKAIGWIHLAFNLMRVLLFIAVAYYYYQERPRLGIFSILVMLYFAIIFFISLFKDQAYVLVASTALPVITMVLMLEILLEKSPLVVTRAIIIALSIMIYTNLAFRIFFPQGYNPLLNPGDSRVRHIFGNSNQFVVYYFPAISLTVFYSFTQGKRFSLNTLGLMAASMATLVIVGSATSLVGLGLLLAYSFIIYGRRLEKLVSMWGLVIIYIILFFLIVIFRQQALFAFFIKGVLGKNLTFTYRTEIWDLALEKIRASFLLGYGQLASNRYINLRPRVTRDAHNLVLQTFLRGGLLGFSSLFAVVGYSLGQLRPDRSSLAKFFLVAIFLYFLMMLMEVYPFNSVFLILLYGAKQAEIIKSLGLERADDHGRA